MEKVLVNGEWRASNSSQSFQAFDPKTGETIEGSFPVSGWEDCEAMIRSAAKAAIELEEIRATQIATFLRCYADRIDANSEAICRLAEQETGLAYQPRLHDVELPRTTRQLRLAADAAESSSWCDPVADPENGLASCLGPIGPVFVIGPNNFPLAFNAISGSDFASAIAARNPVIAKAHPSHPGTSRLLAEQAHAALAEAGLPAATVQMLYQIDPDDGLRMVRHPMVSAVGFTGSRPAGLALKQAADETGTPIYLEMSSVNPVFFLPSTFAAATDSDTADGSRTKSASTELAGSIMLGTGQFCTCPNLFVVMDGPDSQTLFDGVASELKSREPGVLLSEAVQAGLESATGLLKDAGAELIVGGKRVDEPGYRFENTLFKVSGDQFLNHAAALQTEGFGPLSLGVVAKDADQVRQIAAAIEGSLTGSIYGSIDDELLSELTRILRRRVGRVIHNKMPTGVAVSPAMNHGGPFPATGHPGFSAVGMPGTIRRFTKLDCYDNVAPELLPEGLRNAATAHA